MPAHNGGLIALGFCERGGAPKTSAALILKYGKFTATPATNDQVVNPVPIKVEPCDARTRLTELARQRGLASKIVERFFVMRVLDQIADIAKESGGSAGSLPAQTSFLNLAGKAARAPRFANFVDLIRQSI